MVTTSWSLLELIPAKKESSHSRKLGNSVARDWDRQRTGGQCLHRPTTSMCQLDGRPSQESLNIQNPTERGLHFVQASLGIPSTTTDSSRSILISLVILLVHAHIGNYPTTMSKSSMDNMITPFCTVDIFSCWKFVDLLIP
jgi:hypothetical protein